jgi:hypothetical protein
MARVSITNRLPRRGEHSALPWQRRLEHETDSEYLERLVTALDDRLLEIVRALNSNAVAPGSISLSTIATTTDINDVRIGPETRAIMIPTNQNAAASFPTLTQAYQSLGVIRLTHPLSGLTRTYAYALVG